MSRLENDWAKECSLHSEVGGIEKALDSSFQDSGVASMIDPVDDPGTSCDIFSLEEITESMSDESDFGRSRRISE